MVNSMRQFKQEMIYILIMIAVILLGYHEIFLGADFYTYKDTLGSSNYSYGNSLGNGWRPDKAFGISMFYADPGLWHPWSLLTFWESLWPSQASAYSSSIILLGILSALAVYFLLRRVVPEIGGTVSCLLATLIIFQIHCPLEFFCINPFRIVNTSGRITESHHYSTQFQIIPYSYHNHCNSKVYRSPLKMNNHGY